VLVSVHIKRRLLASLLIGSLLATDIAFAELEEITVTARKREENLQDVPLSVTAIGAEQIERLGIRDLKDVTRYTPGVTLDKGFGLNDTRLVIRGLSPSRGRPNSAILVDGIDLTTESVSTPGGSILVNQRLLDIQQVEVVKGPQSALYGRAAFAGAISYVTSDPGDELETEVGIDVGQYGRRYLRGAIGGPVTDGFGLRLNGLAWNEDGYYQEGFTDADLGGGNGYGLSLVGKWDNDGMFAARARVAYSDDDFDQQATFYNPVNTQITPPVESQAIGIDPATFVGIFGGTPPDAGGQISYLTPRPYENDTPADRTPLEGGFSKVLNTSLKLDWDLDAGGIISSYTGYAKADSGQTFDGDFDIRPDANFTEDIARGGSIVDFDTDTRLFSQELRYSSNFNGPVQFSVGALYWDEDVSQIETSITALAIPPWPGNTPEGYFNLVIPVANIIPNNVSRETNSRSVYGTFDWAITDQWKLSLEARYAREQMDVSGTGCDRTTLAGFFACGFSTPDLAFNGPDGFSQLERIITIDSTSDYYLAPKAVIEWAPNDAVMTYFSVSQGVKPGGIATVASGTWMDQQPDGNLDELKFEAETLTAFELGGKTTLFDRQLILNGAVFYQKYDDKQIPVQQLVNAFIATTIENAGEAEIRGLEVESTWLVTEHTRLQLGYSYINGEYTELAYTTNSTNSIARAGNCIPDTVNNLCEINLNGNRMEDVPRNSLVVLGGWYPPLGGTGLSGLFEADAEYEDARFTDEFNDRMVDSYWLMNLRAGVESDRWDAMIYVNNALDNDTIQSWSSGTAVVATAERFDQNLAIFPPDGFSIAPPPRQWGVRANVRF
jgi:outer membrane receptor protein involved in Fe transport